MTLCCGRKFGGVSSAHNVFIPSDDSKKSIHSELLHSTRDAGFEGALVAIVPSALNEVEGDGATRPSATRESHDFDNAMVRSGTVMAARSNIGSASTRSRSRGCAWKRRMDLKRKSLTW